MSDSCQSGHGKIQSSFTNSNIQSMHFCEVNVFGIDQFDVDFAKQPVWSWGKNHNLTHKYLDLKINLSELRQILCVTYAPQRAP